MYPIGYPSSPTSSSSDESPQRSGKIIYDYNCFISNCKIKWRLPMQNCKRLEEEKEGRTAQSLLGARQNVLNQRRWKADCKTR